MTPPFSSSSSSSLILLLSSSSSFFFLFFSSLPLLLLLPSSSFPYSTPPSPWVPTRLPPLPPCIPLFDIEIRLHRTPPPLHPLIVLSRDPHRASRTPPRGRPRPCHPPYPPSHTGCPVMPIGPYFYSDTHPRPDPASSASVRWSAPLDSALRRLISPISPRRCAPVRTPPSDVPSPFGFFTASHRRHLTIRAAAAYSLA